MMTLQFQLRCICFFIFFFCSFTICFSQDIADTFRLPLDNYSICQDYGNSNSARTLTSCSNVSPRHTGQDVACGKANTPVMAIANGKVLYAQQKGTVCDNWGFVMVIEHTTKFGKICSIYGHISSTIPEGQIVSKGDVIGEIGDFSVDCNWSNHLHFGIYNGPFGYTQGTYPLWLNGYMCPNEGEFPGKYLNPLEFLQYQSNLSTNPSWEFFDKSGKSDRSQDLTNSMGWIPYGKTTTVGFNEPGAWIIKVGNDPQIISPLLSFDATSISAIQIHMASLATDRNLEVFFTTDSSPDFSPDKSSGFSSIINDGSYNTYTIPLNNNPAWHGRITRIRIDPVAVGNGSEVVGIQWVKLVQNVNPGAPSNLQATSTTMNQVDRQVNLSWTDNSNNETSFYIERKTGGGDYSLVGVISANTTGFQDRYLKSATTYTYRVYITNFTGNALYSNETIITTQSAPPTIYMPNVSRNIATTTIGQNTIDSGLQVWNRGDEFLVISSITQLSGSAEFTVASVVPMTISPKTFNTTLSFRFSPISYGSKTATFRIICNDPTTPVIDVTLYSFGRKP